MPTFHYKYSNIVDSLLFLSQSLFFSPLFSSQEITDKKLLDGFSKHC